nr:hypothetical protein [Tanacetum cinerariifolium]
MEHQDDLIDFVPPNPMIHLSEGHTSRSDEGTASDGTGKKKGRTVTVTADDMQKRKNDAKARTTLLVSLPDEHQL